MSIQPQVLALMGPTASGKTDLAMRLADHMPVDLISVDSALVYRGLDIGSAKPTAQEQAAYPHALIDILDPSDSYSAADFCRDAQRLITKSLANQRLPVLVGGTMLYFYALLRGLDDLPAKDPVIRAELEARAEHEGLPVLYQQLQSLDPVAAAGMHPNNRQRLIRALEVCLLTQRPMSEQWTGQVQALPWSVAAVGLMPENRSWLHQRINTRFEQMLAQGFADEVRALQARADLHLDLPAIRAVGYRQMWQHLQGEFDQATMLAKAQAASRQLAKRQMTWMRGWPGLQLLNPEQSDNVPRLLKILKNAQTNQ